jgi:rubrerythrin
VNENSRVLLERLAEARRLEKAQTLFYRSLAAEAEDRGLASESERLNELHADEQHHLSRLTARVLELGGDPEDLRGGLGAVELDGWEERARQREDQEIDFYQTLMDEGVLDEETRAVVEEIAESERQHRRHLGGKWMSA